MSFFIRYIVIAALIFNSSDAFANSDIKKLLNQFHEEIEHSSGGSETKSKLENVLSQWLDNFNLVRVSMDTHRWTQMKYYQDSGKSEYIRNFPVLASFYFLSHSIEVFSGPMGVYLASDLGFGNSVQVVVGTVGAIISIPGLDPLCLLLFAVSPLNPVQKMMSGIRVVAVNVSGKVSDKLGLKNISQKIFEKKDRLAEILQSSSKEMVLRSAQEQKPYLILNFKTAEGKTWVESLKVLDPEQLKQNQKDLDRILSQFNVSVRYAIRTAIKNPRKTFYMDVVSAENSTTNIQFQDYAVLLKPIIRLKSQFQSETLSCEGLFQ